MYRYIVIVAFIMLLVANSFSTGQFTPRERVQMEFAFLYERDAIPQDYKNCNITIKSGTPLLMDIVRNRHLLDSRQQRILDERLSRPTLPNSYDTPDGHFKIHYHAALVDIEYVQRCGDFFERSWQVEVDSLGFMPPVSDEGLGGDNRLDVYIMDLGYGLYGVTYRDFIGGPNPWNDDAASIQVNSSYEWADDFPNEDPEGSPWGAFKVTTAHEFFHAIQMAYDADEEMWLLETASVWMEDVVFDYVNDYYNYLSGRSDYIFVSPWKSLMENSMHYYSTNIFFHYLNSRFGSGIINDIFDEMISTTVNGMYAIDAALDSLGENLDDEFLGFAAWNYLTGSRADSFHYDEAAVYPEIAVETVIDVLPFSFIPISSHRPYSFGANYITLNNTSEPGIAIDLTGATAAEWKYAVIIPGDTAKILIPDEYGYVDTNGQPAAIVVVAIGDYLPYTQYAYVAEISSSDAVEERIEKPGYCRISAYPNPFNGKISFESQFSGRVIIRNIVGREVFTETIKSGDILQWNPMDATAGVYFVGMEHGKNYSKILYMP